MPMIFSIAPHGSFDLGAVVKSAYRNLAGSVTVLQEVGCVYDSSRKQGSGRDEFGTCHGYDKPVGALLFIQVERGGTGIFRVTPRESTATDLEAARAAAAKLETTDLGAIATRCQTVWDIVLDVAPEFKAIPSPPPRVLLSLCAVLAAVARGPILLDDGSLLDAKGARERAQELLETAA